MKEIERKFLVKDIPENLNSYPNNRYVQHYISLNPEIRIRSIDDEVFKITVKSDGDLIREEFETNIDEQTFRKMEQISLGKISKTRYKINDFEVDFYDDFKDLITVEIEFSNEKDLEKFIKPTWFGDEITYDKRYKNKNLAINNLKAASDRELLELKRLAEIGKAVEAATLEGYSWVTSNRSGEYSYPNDEDIQDLVSWHKGDMSISECTNNKAMNKNQEVQRESCSHVKTFTYNHGYHTVCEDCGEEL